MDFTPMLPTHVTAVVEAWNHWLPAQFAIDERLLRQVTFGHSSWRWNRSILAWEEGRLQALLIARDHEQFIVIDALIVDPDRRRRGVGRQLISNLGKRPLRVGGGPCHFVPGLPRAWDDSRRFLEKLRFVKDWLAEDLYLRLDARTGPFTCCTSQDNLPVVQFVREEFSVRWTNDTIARFQAGDHGDIVIIKDEDNPIAFCHTWHFGSNLLGPSVFWLRNSCDTFGGIGPVGVAKSARGRGLGKQVVLEALNYLTSVGATEVVVDWTSIGDFYQKCGFVPWQAYDGYHRPPAVHR